MTPEKIKKLRDRLDLSQQEFAEAIGLKSYAWISRMENGQEKPSKTLIMAMKSLK